MSGSRKRPALGVVAYFAIAFTLATYFTFAAVQGDYGLFRRIQVEAEAGTLIQERDALQAQLDEMQNKTRRLSDDYLDLDLLDEQARSVLGMIRSDEIVIR
ncbi:FtsB family cell division protein [Actibacterium lipolyticum]|uniref:Septum formation initiator n=1 Tax=Actibacterium lipolyticum TaxID=1524263 RepID=A0A238KGX1_9RHOB|nr:septum formation initiator family protein [Actibacterium lipolyticum]SMX41968.1 Septum formation initiator [Actibacterium lipolyticum]